MNLKICKANFSIEKRYLVLDITKESILKYNNYKQGQNVIVQLTNGQKIFLHHWHPSQTEFNYETAKTCDYVFSCYPCYLSKKYPDINFIFSKHPLRVYSKIINSKLYLRIGGDGDYLEKDKIKLEEKLVDSIQSYILN